MGIEQRMESGGDIARHVGITLKPRIESPIPISIIKKGDYVSRALRPVSRKIGQPDPIRSVVDSIIPGAAFLPGGSAAGATQIAVEHPEAVVGTFFPPIAIAGGPTGTPGYVAGKAYDELVVQQVKEDPEIPQEFKNQFERDFLEAYSRFERDVYTPPKMPDIKITMPEMPRLLPDFGGIGKVALIAVAIIAAILIIPALLRRK